MIFVLGGETFDLPQNIVHPVPCFIFWSPDGQLCLVVMRTEYSRNAIQTCYCFTRPFIRLQCSQLQTTKRTCRKWSSRLKDQPTHRSSHRRCLC